MTNDRSKINLQTCAKNGMEKKKKARQKKKMEIIKKKKRAYKNVNYTKKRDKQDENNKICE